VTVHVQLRVAPAGVSKGRLAHLVHAVGLPVVHIVRPAAPTLRTLTISSHSVTIKAGQTVRLRLSGKLTNGAPAPKSDLIHVVWMTGDSALAIVNSAGRLTGIAAGDTHVTAQVGSVRASARGKVTATSSSAPGGGYMPPPASAPPTTAHTTPRGGPTTITPSQLAQPADPAAQAQTWRRRNEAAADPPGTVPGTAFPVLIA
jgi:Bacterial Ig-like domain (group 2)